MERRAFKKTMSFFCAFVFALLILCAPLTVRPVQKAHAAGVNDVITIKAVGQVTESGEVTTNDIQEWGYFYRGILSFDESGTVVVSYQAPYGNGQVTMQVIEDEDNTVTFTNDSESRDGISEVGQYSNGDPCPYYKIDQTSNLYTENWGYDFTAGSYNDYGDGQTHWATYDDISLQVGHRPGPDGTCRDCGATLGDDYINMFSFDIPDSIPETGEWETDGEDYPYTSFDITLDENETKIFEGFILILKMQSANGALVLGEDTGAYAVSVTDSIGGEAFEFEDASKLKDEAQIIWQLEVDEGTGEPVEEGVDFRKRIGGTITITLTLTGPVPYPGEYSDTLTFSVELIATE